MTASNHLTSDDGTCHGRHHEPLRPCDDAAVDHRIPRDLDAQVTAGAARFWARRGMRDPGQDNDFTRALARRREEGLPGSEEVS